MAKQFGAESEEESCQNKIALNIKFKISKTAKASNIFCTMLVN